MRSKQFAAFVSLWLVVMVSSRAMATHDSSMGVFVDESSRVSLAPEVSTLVTDVEFLDFDLDGDRDIYAARGDLSGGARANFLFRNDGTGNYIRVGGAGKVAADYTDVDFADITGDARVDGVLSTNLGIERLLLWNTARSRFSDKTSRRMPPAQPADVTIESQFFDADGDGDLDIVTAVEDPFTAPGAQNRLYINNGRAKFTDVTSTNLPAILDDSSAFAIGDFDADGDQDVITVNNEPFVYLQNDGTGHFTNQSATHLPSQPSSRDSGRDAVVSDFDSDGDLDVLFAISRSDQGPLLWLNDGSAVFTDASTTNVPLAVGGTQDVEACDLEGDGDVDIIEANSGAVLQPPADHRFTGAQNRILVNDGTAHFTDVTAGHLPAAIDSSFSVACGDINGDGRADLVVGNGKGEPMKVYIQS